MQMNPERKERNISIAGSGIDLSQIAALHHFRSVLILPEEDQSILYCKYCLISVQNVEEFFLLLFSFIFFFKLRFQKFLNVLTFQNFSVSNRQKLTDRGSLIKMRPTIFQMFVDVLRKFVDKIFVDVVRNVHTSTNIYEYLEHFLNPFLPGCAH